MKTIPVIVALLFIIGLCLAFYMGWFHFDSRSTPSTTEINLTVDKDKVSADTEKAIEDSRRLGQKAVDALPSTTRSSR